MPASAQVAACNAFFQKQKSQVHLFAAILELEKLRLMEGQRVPYGSRTLGSEGS